MVKGAAIGRPAALLVLFAAIPAAPCVAAELTLTESPAPRSVEMSQIPMSALGAIQIIPDRTTEDLRARVKAGSAEAMAYLAQDYAYANGAKYDPAEARRLVDRALAVTKAGKTSEPWSGIYACTGVCQLFFSALPWELPVSKAYVFEGPDPKALKRHAQKGDVAAMSQLGWAYEQGRVWWGLKADRGQAIYWYGRAAAKGDKTAMFDLGRLYGDTDQGFTWYQRAAAAGAPDAAQALADWYDRRGKTGDAELALAQLVKAAEEGDLNAMDEVSFRYAAGRGTNLDKAAAKAWCDRATRELSVDDSSATTNLGYTVVRPARTPRCAELGLG
ncbi:MAG: Sel1 domain protein repeat-containing protein [Caulobacteraceae bacterium]|nr:Sel1 domain protein repeat-containing protein [Caulobacteraceae bacterium]